MKIGDKIQLIKEMKGEYFNEEYRGIPVGSTGDIIKIHSIGDELILDIKWSCNRSLKLIIPDDKIKIIHEK